MYLKQVLQSFLIWLTVLTSMGALVHDFKVNKILELTPPAGASINLASNFEGLKESASHTHVERVTFERTLSVSATPRVLPRDDNRRYMLPKHQRGFNAPDTHTLALQPALA